MSVPDSFGAVVVVLIWGAMAFALAHRLLWRRSRTLLWLASTLIVVGVGYIVATGAAEIIARTLSPVPFDPIKTKEFALRAECERPRQLGVMLILGPVVCVLAPLLLFHYIKYKRTWLTILSLVLFNLCFLLLYVSPIPEKLAPLVFSEDVLKVPDHCRPNLFHS